MLSILKSFKFAFRGIIYCIQNERNMRIHCVVATYLISFMPFFELTKAEISLILLLIACVMSAELVNTAIETVVNRFCDSYDQMVRVAKDVAAGAVFIFALFAIVIACNLLWQPMAFLAIFNFFTSHIAFALLFFLSVVYSICFIFLGSKGIKSKIGHSKDSFNKKK